MKKTPIVLSLLLLIAEVAIAARPPLPEGWRLPEWWDLEGKDRPFLMADFNGDGAIDMATLAVRDDKDTLAVLLWYADEPGKEKWVVLDRQKRPQSLSNLRFETLSDEGDAKRSNIRLCMTQNDCALFSWDGATRTLKRATQPRKPAG